MRAQETRRFNVGILVVTVVALVTLVATAAVFVPAGVDARMVGVFNVDELGAVELVEKALETNSLYPWGFFNYGYFYHTLCFAAVKVAHALGAPADARTIAIAFRSISLVALVLAAFLVFMVAYRRTRDLPVSCLAGLLLVATPAVVHRGHTIHPDVLQMAIVSAALLVVTWRHSARFTVVAAFVTGVAFGTKYAGAFLLPFLLLPLALREWADTGDRAWIRHLPRVAAMCFFAFVAGWVVTNPYAIGHFEAFSEDFLYETRHIERGAGRAESTNPFEWVRLLWGQVTPAGLGLLAVATGAALVAATGQIRSAGRRAFREAWLRTDVFLIVYLACGLFYVVTAVNMRRPRFLFHLYPAMAVLAGVGVFVVVERYPRLRRLLVVVALAAIIALGTRSMRIETSAQPDYENHPRVIAGRFIEARYDAGTFILADAYSYIPPKFENLRIVWGVKQDLIDTHSPDVLVINKALTGRWSWKAEGTRFSDLELVQGDFDDTGTFVAFHRALFRDPQWKVVLESDEVVVLERVAQP